MIIADTGFWVALASPRDNYHTLASLKFTQLQEPLISTWPVITEVCHLLLKRQGIKAQTSFMRLYFRGVFQAFPLEHKHSVRLIKLLEDYADLPMDLADASLVILAEELNHGRILSTDRRDFHTYRWKNTHPFTNLLVE